MTHLIYTKYKPKIRLSPSYQCKEETNVSIFLKIYVTGYIKYFITSNHICERIRECKFHHYIGAKYIKFVIIYHHINARNNENFHYFSIYKCKYILRYHYSALSHCNKQQNLSLTDIRVLKEITNSVNIPHQICAKIEQICVSVTSYHRKEQMYVLIFHSFPFN